MRAISLRYTRIYVYNLSQIFERNTVYIVYDISVNSFSCNIYNATHYDAQRFSYVATLCSEITICNGF